MIAAHATIAVRAKIVHRRKKLRSNNRAFSYEIQSVPIRMSRDAFLYFFTVN